VKENENLSEALQKMSIRELGALPVVREENGKYKILGLIRRSDILLAYNKKVMSFEGNQQTH
jgi:CIC family chloride channel protein